MQLWPDGSVPVGWAILLLGGGPVAVWPEALRAAGEARKVVGVLWHAGSEEEEAVFLVPFRQERAGAP
jgi:hypothetical protein